MTAKPTGDTVQPIRADNRAGLLKVTATDRAVFVWDDELAGFGLRITPGGVRSFVVRYRVGGGRAGRQRLQTLGRFDVMTMTAARTAAKHAINAAGAGRDPLAERDAARGTGSPTVAEFAEKFVEEYAKVYKKATSAAEDGRMVKAYIVPNLGAVRLARLDAADLRKLKAAMSSAPIMFNRVWALLSRMLNWAEELGLRPAHSNPCPLVSRFPERPRQRWLSVEELARLGVALATLEASDDPKARVSPTIGLAVRLLLLTGCRLREILTLRWDQVDTERAVLRLRDSKTGPRSVVLPEAVVDLLKAAPELQGNPHVLPGHRKGAHLTTLRPAWERLVTAADLEGLHIHDLRHSYASHAAIAGESLVVIAGMLGHRELDTTRKYAHLSPDPIREAVQRTAKTIGTALAATPPKAEPPAVEAAETAEQTAAPSNVIPFEAARR